MSGTSSRPRPGEGPAPSPSGGRRKAASVLLGVVLLGPGCSAPPAPDPAPRADRADLQLEAVASPMEAALRRGLVAAKLGDYAEARAQLGTVAASCPGAPLGSRSLLTLVTLDLDPRNPDRDPDRARRQLETYFATPGKPAWTEPMVEALYLLAAELSLAVDTVAAVSEGEGVGRDSVRPGEARDAVADSVSGPGAAFTVDSSPPLRAGAAQPDSLAAGAPARPGDSVEAADSVAAADPRTGDDSPVPPESAWVSTETARDPAAEPEPRVADRILLADEASFSCRSTTPEGVVGIRPPPDLEESPLLERLLALLDERAGLRESNAELARQLAELRQELERIRATLSP